MTAQGKRTGSWMLGAAFTLALVGGRSPSHAQPLPESDAREAPARQLTLDPRERWHGPFPPECGTMKHFGGALAAGMKARFDTIYAIADVLLPDLGVSYDTQLGWGPVLAWPWSVPFGPEQGSELRHGPCADEIVPGLKPHRIVPEVGVTFASQTRGWLRLGYNYVWHPRAAKFGLVFGASPTLTLGRAQASGSLGPELGLRYGACCSPRYAVLVLRYDEHLVRGPGRTLSVKLGLAYW